MSDFLVELGKNPQARQLIKSVGLPIPMPEDLRRAREPQATRDLAGLEVGVSTSPTSPLSPVLAHALAEAGASLHVASANGPPAVFREQCEAFGARLDLEAPEAPADDDRRYDALVVDATGIDTPRALRRLYDYLHPRLRSVNRSGRVVVIGRPTERQASYVAAAAQHALDGFVRSVAKEVGARGSTAQLLAVEAGAESRLAGPLRFFLSPRSAYVTGQVVQVTSRARAVGEVPWARPLEGKVALVTGAARGIGAATAQLLAAEGARVVCLDRPADDGPTARLAREIDGGVLLADVTDRDAPDRIADTLSREYGGVDIVVHNAGITRDKTLARMSSEWWDQAIAVNLDAVAAITARLTDGGPLRDGGRIVCLSSIAGLAGNRGQTNYGASKSGIVGLVRHLAEEVASRGITANAIAPGFIETRLTGAMPFAIREVARRMNSLGQGGRPEDVGQAITFLSTPGAQGVTGQVLRVCGGSLVGA